MKPTVSVVALTDSFAQVWEGLVNSAGGSVRICAGGHELLRSGVASCGVVVAAAGAEAEAIPVLRELREAGGAPVVVVGLEAPHRQAIRLLRAGAEDFFALPEELSLLHAWLEERVQAMQSVTEARALVADQRDSFDFSRMVGRSAALRAALSRAGRIIPRGSATVLITGETGTGKDLLARAIHFNGPRSAAPFVEVNCAAIPAHLLESELFGYERGAFTDAKSAKPGLFEAAHGGTLFLDEIGDLSAELQAKLLTVLENKRVRRLGSVRDQEVDVRILAATRVDLADAVQKGRFREDLFYRLSIVPIHLPALRERGDDVLLLAEHFLGSFSSQYEMPRPVLSGELKRALLAHHWPGNVRELRNAIERALLLADDQLSADDLFMDQHRARPPAEQAFPMLAPLSSIETAAAHRTLAACGGNKTEAARVLGISRRHLYVLLRRNGDAVEAAEYEEEVC